MRFKSRSPASTMASSSDGRESSWSWDCCQISITRSWAPSLWNAGIARQAALYPFCQRRGRKLCIGEASACSQVMQDSLRPSPTQHLLQLWEGGRIKLPIDHQSRDVVVPLRELGARKKPRYHPPGHAAFFEVFPGPWYRESRPSTDENVLIFFQPFAEQHLNGWVSNQWFA